ncbi:MAG TPA: calcium-binding protein [Polyangiaceae bacterium]
MAKVFAAFLVVGVWACSGGEDGTTRSTPEETEPIDECDTYGDWVPCKTVTGLDGASFCDIGAEGLVLTECTQGGSSTPLVLSFDREPVRFTEAEGYFDVFGGERPVRTAWVGAGTPWLALDRDGNGRIDDGAELFGSMTRIGSGERAANGFSALAALDDDADGFITAADSRFAELLIWRDGNQNRRSDAGELSSLADHGVLAIELDYEDVPRCTLAGCEREKARVFVQGSDGVELAEVIDLHLNGR